VDVAAFIVSLVALAWTATWSIYTFRRDRRPAIRVSAVFTETEKEGRGLHGLVVYLSNVGRVETTIPYAALEVEGSEDQVELEQRRLDLPAELVPGQYRDKVVGGGIVTKGLAELQPEGPWRYRLLVYDHTAREHRSNWLDMKLPSDVRARIDVATGTSEPTTGQVPSKD
jgi:hypothetical protein